MLAQIRVKELRNLRTAWLDSGPSEKPILFFLHGYPDSPEVWKFQIRHFEEKYRVICPYSRGTNPSEGSSDTSRYGSEAACLDNLQLLDLVDPSHKLPIILIGHDLGVVHAWNLAYHLGTRLKGLIMMNGMNLQQMIRRLSVPTQILKSWYIPLMNVPYLPEFLVTTFDKKLKNLAYKLGELPEELRPQESSALLPLNQYRAFLKDAVAQRKKKPKKLKCHTLVVWGHRDNFLVPPSADEIEPYSDKVTIRFLNANHWVFRERPSEVNEIIDQYLRETLH